MRPARASLLLAMAYVLAACIAQIRVSHFEPRVYETARTDAASPHSERGDANLRTFIARKVAEYCPVGEDLPAPQVITSGMRGSATVDECSVAMTCGVMHGHSGRSA